MTQQRVEEPLQEVREWKRKVSRATKGMSPKEAVKFFREGAESIWREHGYSCIAVSDKSCKHIK